MSKMTFLEKLLDRAEVKWVALGEEQFFDIANRGRSPVKSSLRSPGETPYYGANNVQDYVEGYTHDGQFVLIAEDGSASLENYSIQYATGKFWANNHVHVVRGREGVSIRYLFHFLRITNFIPYLSGGGRAKLTKGKLVEIQIPIPCPEDPEKSLAIQAEIVRILDTFTELTTRKQQYNYYRDQLLSFEDGEVEWKPLGEVCGFKNGFAFKSSLFKETGFPIIRITNVDGKGIDLSKVKFFQSSDYEQDLSSYKVNRGDILVAMSGATTGKIGCYPDDEIAYLNQRVGKFLPNPKALLNRYLYHYLLSKSESMYVLAGGGAQPNLSSKVLMEKLKIPIPYPVDPKKPLIEQARIVAILDKLDTLAHSISEGLPREIALRQQQYAHYRDQLLSFPESNQAPCSKP